MPEVVVVGSCNVDLVSYVPRLPRLGETLHGNHFEMGPGGKGANQAVMAAKLGVHVLMIACVGNDSFGRDYIEQLQSVGVDCSCIVVTEEASTGVATICVDQQGNNSIVIVPGANAKLTTDHLNSFRGSIQGAKVLVCQMEVLPETTLCALQIAKEEGLLTIFNPAPATPDLLEELFRYSDIVCPNEVELATLSGLPTESIDQIAFAARKLIEKGAREVLVTMGERGALIVSNDRVQHIETTKVKAIDTVGAGDSFVGSLASYLARNEDLACAVHKACQIASISVQKKGAQKSYPTQADLSEINPDLLLASINK